MEHLLINIFIYIYISILFIKWRLNVLLLYYYLSITIIENITSVIIVG